MELSRLRGRQGSPGLLPGAFLALLLLAPLSGTAQEVDYARAERLLEWRPGTSLRALLEKTIDWYIQEYGEVRR